MSRRQNQFAQPTVLKTGWWCLHPKGWPSNWPVRPSPEGHEPIPQPDHGLAETRPAEAVHRLRNVPSTGVEAGGPVMWWGDVAPDQRPTDAFSLVYDSAPLAEATEILGRLEKDCLA